MKLKGLVFIAAITFGLFSLTAEAGRQAVIELEFIKGDNVEKQVHVVTVDDTRFRIDFLGPDMKRSEQTPYIMTVDNGENWVMGSKPKKKFYCTQMQTEQFFKNIGSQVTGAIEFFNIKPDSPVIKKILEEPGPEMQGYSTTHVRVETHAKASARILVIKAEYAVKIIDDLWYTKDFEIHPIRKKWINALMRSDNKIMDLLFADFAANLGGPVLKSESLIEITNVKKNETKTQKERTTVTSLKEVKKEEIDKLFQMPKCKEMSDGEVKDNATDLLSRGKILL